MVYLQKLYEKRSNDGLLPFAIALHPKQDQAQQMTRQMGITYPVFWGYGSELGKSYGFG
jgi:hypothetical protein